MARAVTRNGAVVQVCSRTTRRRLASDLTICRSSCAALLCGWSGPHGTLSAICSTRKRGSARIPPATPDHGVPRDGSRGVGPWGCFSAVPRRERAESIGIIGAGHDYTPLAFANASPGSPEGWELMGGLEEPSTTEVIRESWLNVNV